jgi:hypothetical protein
MATAHRRFRSLSDTFSKNPRKMFRRKSKSSLKDEDGTVTGASSGEGASAGGSSSDKKAAKKASPSRGAAKSKERRRHKGSTSSAGMSSGASLFGEETSRRIVVAIDFGTTYSGYAYAFRRKPDEIHLMRRKEAGQVGGPSHKIPTILLMDEREQFHAFGYDARDTYHDMTEEESQRWLYFEKFKMELHSRKELHQSMELEATNGRRVKATVVFSHALRFFRDTCLKELTDMAIADHPISMADIQWVITVPAIWRQSAKQFMRHAANEVHMWPHTQARTLHIHSCEPTHMHRAHTHSQCTPSSYLTYVLVTHSERFQWKILESQFSLVKTRVCCKTLRQQTNSSITSA